MEEKFKELEEKLQNKGAEVLEKRINRLVGRRFVLFPYLRVKMLLKKLRYLKG